MMPESSMVAGTGDSVYVSGCQLWNGKTGIFTAKAAKMSQNNQPCSLELSLRLVKAASSDECAAVPTPGLVYTSDAADDPR